MLSKTLKQLLILVVILASVCVYYVYGQWFNVFIGNNNQKSNPYYSSLLAKVQKKEITGAKFLSLVKERVSYFPDEPQGWYLLSKLEQGSDNIQKAYVAAKRAYQLVPNDILLVSNYLELLFLSQQGRVTEEIHALVKQIQQQEPDNLIAANISALLAYQKENYGLAIKQWKRILNHKKLSINEKKDYKKLLKKAKQLLLIQYPMQLVVDSKLESRLNNKKRVKSYLYISIREKNKLEPLWLLKKPLMKKTKYNATLTVNNSKSEIAALPLHRKLIVEVRLSTHSDRLIKQGDLYGTTTLYLTEKNKFIAHSRVSINKQFHNGL